VDSLSRIASTYYATDGYILGTYRESFGTNCCGTYIQNNTVYIWFGNDFQEGKFKNNASNVANFLSEGDGKTI
jgi:hypothetical protein